MSNNIAWPWPLPMRLGTLNTAGDELRTVVAEHAQAVDAVRRDGDASDSLKARRLADLDRAATTRIAAVEASAQAALGEIVDHGRPAALPAAEALVVEQRQAIALARVERQIAAGRDRRDVVKDAEAAGDTLTLNAMRRELTPAEEGAAAFIDAALARVGGPDASRAAARVVAAPLGQRLEVQVTSARAASAAGRARYDMSSAMAGRVADQAVASAWSTLAAPAGQGDAGAPAA